jgi:hypothetical protein
VNHALQIAPKRAPGGSSSGAASFVTPVLRRRCACGASASVTSECEGCRADAPPTLRLGAADDAYEREADRAADRVMRFARSGSLRAAGPVARVQRRGTDAATGASEAPPAVHAVLATTGRPLEPRSRSVLERAFGHDFGRVRIHTDAPSAASARSVGAHAYTVGNHVVFGAGRFAPASGWGLRLLAHELAHVVQSRDVVQRESISPLDGQPRRIPDDETDEAPAPVEPPAAEEEREGSGGAGALELRRFPEDEDLAGPWPEKDVADCFRRSAPDPAECDPVAPLQWTDFTGAVPRRSAFAAGTFSDLRERDVNLATFACTPDAAVAAGLPTRALQAFFVPARSWVKPQSSQAGDPAQNGCAQRITECRQHFDRQAARGFTNITFSLNTRPPPACPASAVPRGDVANSRADCATVVGADCADRALAESARLLQHERTHFDLTCAMARKANALIAGGQSAAAVLEPARRALRTAQARYDSQTQHGCRPAAQANWEAAIAAGLPAIDIRLGRRRRRGR